MEKIAEKPRCDGGLPDNVDVLGQEVVDVYSQSQIDSTNTTTPRLSSAVNTETEEPGKECNSDDDLRMHGVGECETKDSDRSRYSEESKDSGEKLNERDGGQSLHEEYDNDDMRMHREGECGTKDSDRSRYSEESKDSEEKLDGKDGEASLHEENKNRDSTTTVCTDAHYANGSVEEKMIDCVKSVEKKCDSNMEEKSAVKEALVLLSLLPPELRCLIYSKMILVDRIKAAEMWPDSEISAYFEKNRILVDFVTMDIRVDRSIKCIAIEFQCSNESYSEYHRLTEDVLPLVKDEVSCVMRDDHCYLWWDMLGELRCCSPRYDRVYQFRPDCDQNLFYAFKFVVVKELRLKSYPSGGLVDLVQPKNVINMAEKSTVHVLWDSRDPASSSSSISHDHRTSMTRWGSWLNALSHPPQILTIATKSCVGGECVRECDCDILSMPNEMFDIPAVQKAVAIKMPCFRSDITLQQLSSIQAIDLVLNRSYADSASGSSLLTIADSIVFFGEKIKGWLQDPEKLFRYQVQSFERSQNYQGDYEKLLQDAMKDMIPTGFCVYREYCPQKKDEYCEDTLSIRCMQNERFLRLSNFAMLGLYSRSDERDRRCWKCDRLIRVTECTGWPIPIWKSIR